MKYLYRSMIEALLSTHFLLRSTFKTFFLILFMTAAPVFDVSAQDPPPSQGFLVWGYHLPLDMSASDVVISGTNKFSRAGDVNGDGLDDFIVSTTGAVYVVFGSADGLPDTLDYTTPDGSNGFVVSYEPSDFLSPGDNMGRAAGDINDDGFDDIIIGNPTKEADYLQYTAPSGEVYIVFGRSTFPDSVDVDDLDGTNGFTIEGIDGYGIGTEHTPEGYSLGIAVNGAGDVNGDGFDDFLLANRTRNIGDGLKAFVVFGKRDGFAAHFDLHALDGSNGFVIRETAASLYFRPDLSSAGDVNGDGADDILIGAQYSDRQQGDGTFVQGKRVFVVLGKPDGSAFPATVEISTMDGSNGFTVTGENIYDEDNSAYRVHLEGTSKGNPSSDNVLGTGDINGDGVDDFMIGAPWAPSFDFVIETLLTPYESEQEDVGEVYVIFGRQNGSFPANMDVATLMNGTDGFIIKGLFTHGRFGWSLSADGDINSDGINDIIVGTPNSFYSTFAAVLYGKSTGFPASVDLRDMYEDNMGFVIENTVRGVGTTASIVGDMNGDGTDDFMLGTGNNRYPTPSSYVFYGEKKPIAPILSNSIADQQTQEDELFNFTIPDNTFTDQNPNDTQTLSAQLTGGDALPSWLTFDPETGAFSGIPLEEGDVGILSVEVISTDEDMLSVTDTFSLEVISANDAPLLMAIGDQSGDEGIAITFIAAATDVDLPANTLIFSLDAVSLAAGMAIDGATGTFHWIPSEAQNGDHEVVVTVTDDGSEALADMETISVFVNEVNVAPELAEVENLSIYEKSTFSFIANATDSDLPENGLNYSLDETSLGKGMTIDGTTGVFSWTPTDEYLGDHEVTLTVADDGAGTLTDSKVFTITVEAKIDQIITFNTLNAMTFGDADFDLSAAASSGLEVVYTSSNPMVATILDNRVTLVGAGTATITAGQPGSTSHNAASDVLQNLVVNRAILVVTAENQTKTYNATNPTLAISYGGFVGSDVEGDLDELPTASTTADLASDVGSYPIIVSGGSDNNYDIQYAEGVLNIIKAQGSINLSNLEQEVDGTNKTPTVSTDPTDLNVEIVYDDGVAPVEVGDYDFTAIIDEPNYEGQEKGILKLVQILGLTDTPVLIYPNPAEDYIKIDSEKNLTVEVMNLEGKSLFDSNSKEDVDISGLSSGTYLLRLTNKDGDSKTIKFIKSN